MGLREDFNNRPSAEERRADRRAKRRHETEDEWAARVIADRDKRRAEIDRMARESAPPWWLA